mmetsp:Transcript_31325/g.50314  ORF Transcript_31325/g.50314 Transcript_31325/m.50314 type:complete len:303 (-) Transcript_31325:1986-2894(-)
MTSRIWRWSAAWNVPAIARSSLFSEALAMSSDWLVWPTMSNIPCLMTSTKSWSPRSERSKKPICVLTSSLVRGHWYARRARAWRKDISSTCWMSIFWRISTMRRLVSSMLWISGSPVLAAGATSSMKTYRQRLSRSMRNLPSRRGRWMSTTTWIPLAISAGSSETSPSTRLLAVCSLPSLPSGDEDGSFASLESLVLEEVTFASTLLSTLLSTLASVPVSVNFSSLPSFTSATVERLATFVSVFLNELKCCARSFSRMYLACSMRLTEPACGSHWRRNTDPSLAVEKKSVAAALRSRSVESS